MADQKPEAQAVADLVKALHNPQLVKLPTYDGSVADISALIVPSGMNIASIKEMLDEYREKPERITGTARVTELDSFIAHALRFKAPNTALFALADSNAPRLLAVYDYHDRTSVDLPNWQQHRTEYAFPLSDEWVAWNGKDETSINQSEFAAWIEDHIADVLDPAAAGDGAKQFASQVGVKELASPARLLELSRGLSIREDSRLVNAVNLQTGEGQLTFESKHTDESGAPVRVPGAFVIAVPVFKGGALYQLPVRLRYRKQSTSILWSFSLYRPERIFDHAFREACSKAQASTELPLFFGTPES